jgi:uncharacterized membrane protein HdeD (DUF308 family)
VLSGLAVNWVFLLLRAAVAAMFGIAAVAWPAPSSWTLVMLFGAYAAADGMLALLVALSVKGVPGFGSLLFEALVRLGVAAFAFASPARMALALPDVFAAWAVLSGVGAIAVAIALRRELTGEWPLPLAGAVSVLAGVLLAAGPGAPDLRWVAGPYALLFAFTLLALGLRFRQLAHEIAVAS